MLRIIRIIIIKIIIVLLNIGAWRQYDEDVVPYLGTL